MLLAKRIGLPVLFSLAGAVSMYIYGWATRQAEFVKWEPLGQPPGKAVKLVAFDYVKTASGDIYNHVNQPGCTDDCWVKSDAPPPDDSKYWLASEPCGGIRAPALDNLVDLKAACSYYGLGFLSTVEAVDKNGFVYSWGYTSGGEWEGAIPWVSAFIGAAAGLIIGLIVLLVVLYMDLMKWLQKRAHQKGITGQA